MSPRNRGLMMGLGGMLAGFIATRLVIWPVFAEAALAVGVTVMVATLLWALTRPKSTL